MNVSFPRPEIEKILIRENEVIIRCAAETIRIDLKEA
jgi:hypothetical protein